MQSLTIEVPDDLADRLRTEQGRLTEIIERGLETLRGGSTALGRELVSFLARGPRPEEIVAFRPSATCLERADELLEKNRSGELSSRERGELEEMAALNHLFTRIKAEARGHLKNRPPSPA